MNLILFGFKGCGKTHFGRLLAQTMRRPFIDTDDLISELFAQQKGKRLSPKEIYKQMGKDGFRALEREAILRLEGVQDSIISLGGGAVLDPDNVAFLQKLGELVYLEAGPETLRKRVMSEELPAFLDAKDPLGSFVEMVHERKPIYESIPARRINTENLDEAGVLAALRSILILEEPPNGF
jgi:shikimate kinase